MGSEEGPLAFVSGLFRLSTEASSRRKLGPDPTTGVAKLRGLGSVLLSWFLAYKSGKNWLGLGRNSLFMYREGRADAGVSIILWLGLLPLLLPLLLLLLLLLGAGLAKGLGGPVAPADSNVVVLDGDGGGRTIPDPCDSPWRVVCEVASVECPGPPDVDSAVLLPVSEGSSGICTLSRGRDPPPPPPLPIRKLLDREGSSGIEDVESWRLWPGSGRLGCGGEAVLRDGSRDDDRFPFASSFLMPDSAKAAKCCDKTDRFSSIGVNMLCCFRWGSFLIADAVSSNGAAGTGLSRDSVFGSSGAGGPSWLGGCSIGRACGEARRVGALGRPCRCCGGDNECLAGRGGECCCEGWCGGKLGGTEDCLWFSICSWICGGGGGWWEY